MDDNWERFLWLVQEKDHTPSGEEPKEPIWILKLNHIFWALTTCQTHAECLTLHIHNKLMIDRYLYLQVGKLSHKGLNSFWRWYFWSWCRWDTYKPGLVNSRTHTLTPQSTVPPEGQGHNVEQCLQKAKCHLSHCNGKKWSAGCSGKRSVLFELLWLSQDRHQEFPDTHTPGSSPTSHSSLCQACPPPPDWEALPSLFQVAF